MTHVMAPDERRRRLASGADLHASGRYDGAQPCSRSRLDSYPRTLSNAAAGILTVFFEALEANEAYGEDPAKLRDNPRLCLTKLGVTRP